jgi:hypothetical protein
MLDERLVGRWCYCNGLLYQTIEKLPAVLGGAPVEPECELIEVVVQVFWARRALVRAKAK